MICDNIHSIQKIMVFKKKHCELPDARNRISQISQEYKISQISQKTKYLIWKRYNFKEMGKACIQTSSCRGHKTFSTLRRPTLTVSKTSSVSPRGKMNEKQNLFGRILWFCEALIVQHIFYFGPGECCPQRESAVFAPFLHLTQASWAKKGMLWRGSDSQTHYSSKFWPKEHNLAANDLLMWRKSSANVSILEMPV